MQEKTEESQLVKIFCVVVKTQFGANMKVIRSDNNRSEFTSGPMKKFYGEHGIIHQTSCVDTPQQNGRVERKHRHVLNVVRALLFQANLPLEFWGECILVAAYLINRTPLQFWMGRHPMKLCLKPSLLMTILGFLDAYVTFIIIKNQRINLVIHILVLNSRFEVFGFLDPYFALAGSSEFQF